MRFAYADPPYIGQAKKHYGSHEDYAGEVDHRALIERMESEFDCWALSLSMKSLPAILRLCPNDALTLAWTRTNFPPMGDNRIYSWEPVITHGGRNPEIPTRLHLAANHDAYSFRDKPATWVMGMKPEAFAFWLFACMGLVPGDEFTDLFPGSGAMTTAWARWCDQQSFDFAALVRDETQ